MITVKTILEKGSGIQNEDNLFINNDKNIFAVFDGATSLNKYIDPITDNTGGFIASQTAIEIFQNNPDKNPKEIFIEINNTIKAKMIAKNIDTSDINNRWSTAAAVIKIDNQQNTVEWAQISDCQILFLYKDKHYKLANPNYEHDSETLTLKNKLNDQQLKDQLIKVRRQANVSYGFLNGDPKAKDFIVIGSESLADISDIILFTDGLLIPNPTPDKPDDFDKFIFLYQENGIENIKNYVRKLEENDPQLTIFPRFKIHDDIAAISIKI
jgi:serine/threonine protein phosphatase PrpC